MPTIAKLAELALVACHVAMLVPRFVPAMQALVTRDRAVLARDVISQPHHLGALAIITNANVIVIVGERERRNGKRCDCSTESD